MAAARSASAAAGHRTLGVQPGIAWAAGHLAETSSEEFLLIVGTGHAASYLFAQQVLRSSATAAAISDANRLYGQADGEPTELLGIPDVPYVGGELGPALGVGQGIAAARAGLRVVTVIGDGECETPAALVAFAHHDVLAPAPGASWLPVINVNGARMGFFRPVLTETTAKSARGLRIYSFQQRCALSGGRRRRPMCMGTDWVRGAGRLAEHHREGLASSRSLRRSTVPWSLHPS